MKLKRSDFLFRHSIAVALAAAGLFLCSIRALSPPLAEDFSYSRVLRDRNGHILRVTLSQDEKYRMRAEPEKIPNELKDILFAYEDRFFYAHPGVNIVSIVKAAFAHVARGERAGASTITMQVARLHYKFHTKTFSGKLKQIALALWLEMKYSKAEILDAYFQLAPYGGNIEGIQAAAFFYFDRPLKKLTREQIASLILIPQNPNVRKISLDPDLNARWATARKILMKRWNELNPARPMDVASIELPMARDRREKLNFEAPHFVNMVLNRAPQSHDMRTTLDLPTQKLFEKIVHNYIRRSQTVGVKNAAALLIDTTDMSIRAYLGSADFWQKEISGQVDGVQALRSPGSTLKPFIYALAMDQGLIHPASLLRDTPQSFGGFDPENFERDYRGPLLAQDALVRSRNIPAISLAMRLKGPTPYEFLKGLGVRLRGDSDFYGLTVVLGGAEVSLENLGSWYAALARQQGPRPLRYLVNEKESEDETHWHISRESSYLVLQMLKENPRDDISSFEKFRTHREDAAWKTGTSAGFRDAWTIGVFRQYVLGVWMGNFDGQTNPSLIGRSLAAPLFFELAEAVNQADNTKMKQLVPFYRWQQSFGLNIAKLEVCGRSGGLPTPHCHHRKTIEMIPGHSPIGMCGIHKNIPVSRSTGLRMCPTTNLGDSEFAGDGHSDVKWKTYEFWPSDIQDVLRSHGVHIKSPPPFEKNCTVDQTANLYTAGLEIQSPRRGVRYSIQWKQKEKSTIPLMATSDQSPNRLSWFINRTLIGQSEPSKPIFWSAAPGHHEVTVTDDFGRSVSEEIDVDIK